MNQSRRKFIKIGGLTTIAGFSGLGFTLLSCSSDNSIIDENNSLNISGVSIPSSINVAKAGELMLTGKGFRVGDTMEFESLINKNLIFKGTVVSVTENTFTFSVPSDFESGNYKVKVIRNAQALILRNILFNVVANTNIPDISGKNIKGVVYSNGKGVPGVVVSDGYEVTVTDSEGRYYLSSLKKSRFCFYFRSRKL